MADNAISEAEEILREARNREFFIDDFDEQAGEVVLLKIKPDGAREVMFPPPESQPRQELPRVNRLLESIVLMTMGAASFGLVILALGLIVLLATGRL